MNDLIISLDSNLKIILKMKSEQIIIKKVKQYK